MKLTNKQIEQLEKHGWNLTIKENQTIYKTIANNPNDNIRIEMVINPYNMDEDFILYVDEFQGYNYLIDSDLTSVPILNILKELEFIKSIGLDFKFSDLKI